MTAGDPTAAEAAAALGALATANALCATSGVHISLTALGTTTDGGLLAVLLCAAAAAVAAVGQLILVRIPSTVSTPSSGAPPSDRARRTGEACAADAQLARTFGTVGAAIAIGALPPAAACRSPLALMRHMPLTRHPCRGCAGSVLVQRHAEALPTAPSSLDRVVDAGLRLVLQSYAAAPLAARFGARGSVLVGTAILAAGALLGSLPAGGSLVAQLSAHHLMTSGLHVAEVAAATLIVRAANACGSALPGRVMSLVALHLLVTLGPGLLPVLGEWGRADNLAVGDGVWKLLALLPLPVLAMLPSRG